MDRPLEPSARYGVQPGHDRNITELHIPTPHGALRGGDEVTKSGGLYVRSELERLFQNSHSPFSYERVPVRAILREKGLPYRTEPETGVRNAAQIIAISEYATERLGALMDAHEFPIVVGGDHASVLMGLPEVLDRFPDPEQPDRSALRIVFIDAHPDILGDPGNAVGNAHGRTISTLLGKGPNDLAPIMEGRRTLKPENIFFVGIRNPDAKENTFMIDNIPMEHRKYLDDNLDWDALMRDLRKFLYEDPRAPLWAEIDPDVMSQRNGGEGVPMPSDEGTSSTHLYAIAREIAARGNLVGMGTAEIARKKDKRMLADGTVTTPEHIGEIGSTGSVLSQFFFKALGKGDAFYNWEYKPHAISGTRRESARSIAQSPKRNGLRKKMLAWIGGMAAGMGGLMAWQSFTKTKAPLLAPADAQVTSVSNQEFLRKNRERLYRFMKDDVRRQIDVYGSTQGSDREHQEYAALLRTVWDAESLASGKKDRADLFQYLLSELVNSLGPQQGSEVYRRLKNDDA